MARVLPLLVEEMGVGEEEAREAIQQALGGRGDEALDVATAMETIQDWMLSQQQQTPTQPPPQAQAQSQAQAQAQPSSASAQPPSASAQPPALRRMSSLEECSVCLEVFTERVVTRCQHMFCKRCIQEVMSSEGQADCGRWARRDGQSGL